MFCALGWKVKGCFTLKLFWKHAKAAAVIIVIIAGTQGTPPRTYPCASAKRESRVKGLGPHTSGNSLSTPGETGNTPASMATNQNWWGRYKGKSLDPWGSICTHIADLEEHFSMYFQGHRELQGALSFLPSSYLSSPLPLSFPFPPQNISLCAFPISFPNKSLLLKELPRKANHKDGISLSQSWGHRDSSHEGLVWACFPDEFLDIPCPVAGGGYEGGVMKGERKPFFSQFGYASKARWLKHRL